MLGFETETEAAIVNLAVLAFDGAVKEIAGIELHAWLRSQHFHRAPGCWLVYICRCSQDARLPSQDKVVVIAISELKLFIVLLNSRADCRDRSEIEWRAL